MGNDVRQQLRDILFDRGGGISSDQIDRIEALISTRENEARIDELERLDHDPQMFGDWQQVVDDRIKQLNKKG